MPLFGSRSRNTPRELPPGVIELVGETGNRHLVSIDYTPEGFALKPRIRSHGYPYGGELEHLKRSLFTPIIADQSHYEDLTPAIVWLLLEAEDVDAPPFNLTPWVSHPDPRVRAMVARQKSITQRDLRALSQDSNLLVAFCAVTNPRQEHYVGIEFGTDPDQIDSHKVCDALLISPHRSEALIQALVTRDHFGNVRERIALYQFDRLTPQQQHALREDEMVWKVLFLYLGVDGGGQQDAEERAIDVREDWRSYAEANHVQGQSILATFDRWGKLPKFGEFLADLQRRLREAESVAANESDDAETVRIIGPGPSDLPPPPTGPGIPEGRLDNLPPLTGEGSVAVFFKTTREGFIDTAYAPEMNNYPEEFDRLLRFILEKARHNDAPTQDSATIAAAGIATLSQRVTVTTWISHPDFRIRALTAKQDNLPEEALRQLTFDPHPFVRFVAACNPAQANFSSIEFGLRPGQLDYFSTCADVLLDPDISSEVLEYAWKSGIALVPEKLILGYAISHLDADTRSHLRESRPHWDLVQEHFGLPDMDAHLVEQYCVEQEHHWRRFHYKNAHGVPTEEVFYEFINTPEFIESLPAYVSYASHPKVFVAIDMSGNIEVQVPM